MNKQTLLFNRMLNWLQQIWKWFMTPSQIRKDCKNEWLSYEEYLEMSYENIQQLAKQTIKWIRAIKS